MDSSQQDTNAGGNQRRPTHRNNNKWAGLILLGVGAVLLLNTLGANLPSWLISWKMLLIVVGIAVGAASRFRDFTWIVISGVGAFFLLDELFPDVPFSRFLLPGAFIVVGLLVLYGSKGNWFRGKMGKKCNSKDENNDMSDEQRSDDPDLEAVAVFGAIKKVIYNKSFNGGEVVTVFGGAEIDLLNADFNGVIQVEAVQIFGGVKLKVPAHWEVNTAEAVAIFGGIEDKRPNNVPTDPTKRLIVRGTIIFGGLEIRTY
ncbi:MAG: LiaF transmembrane domain-containing protein [Pseudobacter sp.]|uniref:LiaF transmembrane domain-containing protein n=1 Tax=Pseudobacter sp. TaxID=2045420 RepID=UPI003F817A55